MKLKISPDQRKIITVGSEGAIFFWDTPQSVAGDRVEPELPTHTKEEASVKGSMKSSVKGSVKGSMKGSVKK